MIPLSELLKTLSATLISISVAYAQIPAEYTVYPTEKDAPKSSWAETGVIPPNTSFSGVSTSSQRILARNTPIPVAESFSGNAPIRSLIVKYAKEYGVSEYLMLSLADIESDYKPLAKNPRSSALGVFQWLRGSWSMCEGKRENAEDNIRCAARVISEGGISHWCNPETKRELIKLGIKDCK